MTGNLYLSTETEPDQQKPASRVYVDAQDELLDNSQRFGFWA